METGQIIAEYKLALGALVVTLAMLLRLINCRFIIIIIIIAECNRELRSAC